VVQLLAVQHPLQLPSCNSLNLAILCNLDALEQLVVLRCGHLCEVEGHRQQGMPPHAHVLAAGAACVPSCSR
jgi:hypothetical protein